MAKSTLSEVFQARMLQNLLDDVLEGNIDAILFTDEDLTPNPATLAESLTQPTNTDWYAPNEPTINEIRQGDAGAVEVEFSVPAWDFSGSGSAETVYGLALVTTGSFPMLVVSKRLDEPVIMQNSLSQVLEDIVLEIPAIVQ